ncbi:hypothetical protein COCMIDRAFT_93645 [Bipolaris oryzae ATCC 44560]|uniref:Uncharacterized protein n=1 Tax=Bipolaris oryzae ATCC 44560 TaxID=930090 RepID=W6Z813_COCMI|nr:uncharacterized protein COCMIDRAFT_93645 [Bipolaris oryzae ATCC 44560]EUC46145.1 hypothetical protein COCMIDRAFT_93645 [Bipolaris oryzae ATCC 44560]
MNNESHLATPLAQPPRMVPGQPETAKAATWRDDDSQSATSDGLAPLKNNIPKSRHQAYELPAPNSTMALPAKTGGSLLSQISAMVSEEGSAPYSRNIPGKPNPSAVCRMQPQLSNKQSRAPVQIPRQSPPSHDTHTSDGQGNDLDLYADYNGIVKDLRDEMGQPLRVSEARVPSPEPQQSPTKPEAANVQVTRESQDGEQQRYSTDRPMSFIAGPADQDGKPQDQINQSASPDDIRVRRAFRQRRNHAEQHQLSQGGAVYSELPAEPLDTSWNSVQSPPTPGAPPPKNILRTAQPLDPTRPAYIDPPRVSGEANSQERLSGTPGAHDQQPQTTHIANLALHQPRAKRVSPVAQIVPDFPLEQSKTPSSQFQDLGQEQQQTDRPSRQDMEKRKSTNSAQSSVYEASKSHEKISSKGKISSIFKKFGGNGQASSQQRQNLETISAGSNLNSEGPGRLKPASSVKRPSVDQQSQANQKSSLFDLKKQRNPAAFYSIPYQQSTANVPNHSSQSNQPDVASGAKPKRNSGLGAIFGKDGPSVDGMVTKFKLSSSKEDKKAQKAKGDSTKTQVKPSQQTESPRPSISDTRPEEPSAFLRTKQLAEEHQAQQSGQPSPQVNIRPVRTSSLMHNHGPLFDRLRQEFPNPPNGEYYWPNDEQTEDNRGAYAATVAARQQYEQLQMQRQKEQAAYGQGEYRDPYHEQQQQQLQSSRPLPGQNGAPISGQSYVSQNATSAEPSYEATPIPAAYGHVSGAYVAHSNRQDQPIYPPQHVQAAHVNHPTTQYADPWMPPISPQISGQSQMYQSSRSHSDDSNMHVVSPISRSASLYSYPPHHGAQRTQKPRMGSISEVSQQDRPWHLNFPAGATEQEIVRARQGQYMQALFNAQQQQQAERAAGTPSPHTPQHTTPTNTVPHEHAQGGGFRELLPSGSPQPYRVPHSESPRYEQPLPTRRHPAYEQQVPTRSEPSPQPAAYPLPESRNSTRPAGTVNPPPNLPYSPTRNAFPDEQMYQNDGQQYHQNPSPKEDMYQAPVNRSSEYDAQIPDEAPPSYDGIGVPNEGMDKSRPDAVRPPNINTNVDGEHRSQRLESRPRQPSIGMLQHPQPASMAASPQRTLSDMGAESLRRQLLQQENIQHMERVQRERERREAIARERQQREAARARARELERSVSSGGQVGSLRTIGGSFSSAGSSWGRTGSQHRQVFELSALDDDEPVMKATSYPGQEWTPPMWDGD